MVQRDPETLVDKTREPLIAFLSKIVLVGVKALAILMVFVILWSLIDVVVHLYAMVTAPLPMRFEIENIIDTVGVFLVVLIAIEIFLNIIFYLKQDAIHVPLVLATALTAIARKVIVLDYTQAETLSVFATSAVIFAVGITYWLITRKE